MYFDFLRSVKSGYVEGKKSSVREQKYKELEHFPMLFSSQYLSELYLDAETPEECDEIMTYMFRFDCVNQGIESYDKLFNKLNKKHKKLAGDDQ